MSVPGEEAALPADERADSFADQVWDELLPDDIDWRRLVRDHPVLTLGAAATAGFFLGRGRGAAILAALSAFGADAVARNVNEFLGEDLL